MKIEVHKPPVTKGVLVRSMEVGQMGYIVSSPVQGYIGKLILRTYSGAVELGDPRNTWQDDAPMRVELLPVGSRVVLEATN